MADHKEQSHSPPPAPSTRPGTIIFLAAPFAIVALLILIELVYAGNHSQRPVGAGLSSFHGTLFLCELIVILAGLSNVLLMPAYLSQLDADLTDRGSSPLIALLAGGIYLAALIKVFLVVVEIHFV